ncbi:MAG: hypothetical protein AB3A66_23810 [Nodularia sp. CChRGM 3473]
MVIISHCGVLVKGDRGLLVGGAIAFLCTFLLKYNFILVSIPKDKKIKFGLNQFQVPQISSTAQAIAV